jgi:hypothetical protein
MNETASEFCTGIEPAWEEIDQYRGKSKPIPQEVLVSAG